MHNIHGEGETACSMRSISDRMKSLFGSPSDAPQVSYSSQGRSGYVHYRSKECNLDMYYEFAGGDVVASIQIPTPREWTAKTGLPLERRASILEAIGRQVARDQTTDGRGSHEVDDNWIHIRA